MVSTRDTRVLFVPPDSDTRYNVTNYKYRFIKGDFSNGKHLYFILLFFEKYK